LVSFSSVVGYNSVESDLDFSVEENAISIEFELQRIGELVQSINLREIIVNPDAVLETLEEVSSILEEENVRNYIEKSSEEDCGCEDKPTLKREFTTICMVSETFAIIFILMTFGGLVFALPFFLFFVFIGFIFGCDWVKSLPIVNSPLFPQETIFQYISKE